MTEAGRRRLPWLGIAAGGIAIAGVVLATLTFAAPALSRLSVPALWVFAGLVPLYVIAWLASRARHAQRRFLASKWLLLWIYSRLAFLAAIVILAPASAAAAAIGAASAEILLDASLLTIVLSVMVAIAGSCAINLAQAIAGPEPER